MEKENLNPQGLSEQQILKEIHTLMEKDNKIRNEKIGGVSLEAILAARLVILSSQTYILKESISQEWKTIKNEPRDTIAKAYAGTIDFAKKLADKQKNN